MTNLLCLAVELTASMLAVSALVAVDTMVVLAVAAECLVAYSALWRETRRRTRFELSGSAVVARLDWQARGEINALVFSFPLALPHLFLCT